MAQGASFRNGAVICPSMAYSWANLAKIRMANPGGLKTLRLGWRALKDPQFYVWLGWFCYNCLLPGRSDYNHQSCGQLAWLRSVSNMDKVC